MMYFLFYLFGLIIVWCINGLGLVSSQITYWIYTIMLIIFLLTVLKDNYNRKGGICGLLSLTSMYLIFQGLIQNGIGNFSILYEVKDFSAGWDYLCKATFTASLSSAFFYLGSCSFTAEFYGRRLHEKILSSMDDRQSMDKSIALVGLAIVIPIYIIALRLGIVGYSDSTNLNVYTVYANISTYITYIINFIPFVALLFWTDYFMKKRKYNKASLFGCVLLTVVYVLCSLLTGMKEDIICFAVALFILVLLDKRKVSIPASLLLVVAVYIAFSFIPNYRDILRSASFSGDRISALVQAFSNGTSGGIKDAFGDMLSRINLSQAASAVIKYKDEIGLSSTSPTFLSDLLLAPITCFIPRSLLPGKSMSTYGIWVYQVVYGYSTSVSSSAYVTVHGFLYLAGGTFGVVVFSYLIALLLTFYSGFISADDENIYSIPILLLIGMKIIFELSTPIDLITPVTRSIIIYLIYSRLLLREDSLCD